VTATPEWSNGFTPGRDATAPRDDTTPSAGEAVPLAPAPAPDSAAAATSPSPARGRGRFGLDVVVPLLLAAFGLSAALIAWRATVAAAAIDDANQAGLTAARLRSSSGIVSEGITARTIEAYTDFERGRRRGELLAADHEDADAQLARMEATSHWFLVFPEYLDRAGAYDADLHRAALLAGEESRRDIRPEPHFATADAETARLQALILAGIVVALALPFLTLAEIGRGRLRGGGAVMGAGLLLAGVAIAAVVWL
jgi:hypothetical protein